MTKGATMRSTADKTPAPAPTPAHPVDALAGLAAAGTGRIERAQIGGRSYWIKRQEALRGLMRLQKGSPGRALAAERQGLRALGALGLPVPDLVAEGAGFLVVADCGPSVDLLLRDPAADPAEKRRALIAAGAALARLHGAGVAHGRPSIRDFCWQDGRITLIDWERYRPRGNTRSRMQRDLVIFVHSLYTLLRGDAPLVEDTVAAYRAAAPAGLWDEAARLCRRLRWLDRITRAQQRRDAGRGEFRAIPLTLRRFGAL